jgi:hypothetical protein
MPNLCVYMPRTAYLEFIRISDTESVSEAKLAQSVLMDYLMAKKSKEANSNAKP